MRLAVYYLIIVLVTLAVVGTVWMGVGVIGLHPSDVAEDRTHLRDVFVDLDRIVVLHPGWEAVRTMRVTASEIRDVQPAGAERPADVGWLQLPDVKARATAQRWKLEDSAARRADEALEQLEAEQIEALNARVEATRKTMVDSAESDLRIRAFEIEEAAGDEVSSISRQRVYEQINLRLRVDSLRAMLGRPGVRDSEVRQRLEVAEQDLAALEREIAAEIAGVNTDAYRVIIGLRETTESKIDAALSAYAERERRDIVEVIRDARNQAITEICSLDDIYAPNSLSETVIGERASVAWSSVMAPGPRYTANREANELLARSEVTEERIRTDLRQTLRELGNELGVNVVFTSSVQGIPDETEIFAGLMMERGWMYTAPVLNVSKPT